MFLELLINSVQHCCVVTERRGRDSVEEFQHDPGGRLGSAEHVKQLARSSQRLGTTLRAHEPSIPNSALQPAADSVRTAGKYRASLTHCLYISLSLSLCLPSLSFSAFRLWVFRRWFLPSTVVKLMIWCVVWIWSLYFIKLGTLFFEKLGVTHHPNTICEAMTWACNDNSILSSCNTTANYTHFELN